MNWGKKVIQTNKKEWIAIYEEMGRVPNLEKVLFKASKGQK